MIERKKDQKQKVSEVKTFTVPFTLGEVKENISININTPSKISKEQIIKQAIDFHLKGNINEAAEYYQNLIDQGLKDHRVFSNYGVILKNLGKLKEAELSYRKAIEIKPDFAEGHSNLGNVLNDLGKLKDAELSYRKAIEINPDFAEAYSNMGITLRDCGKSKEAELSMLKAISLNPNLAKAYFNLSTLNPSSDNEKWKDKLFSDTFITNQKKNDLVDIYFARANLLEKENNFSQVSNNLKKANNLSRRIHGSNFSYIKKEIDTFFQDWEERENDIKQIRNLPIPIFIVGMPRSGKTITESILACNNKLIKYGENLALEKAIKSYLTHQENSLNKSLYKLYFDQIETNYHSKSYISTTTPLNLIYTGLTISQIPTAKFIFCERNPLDNIIEIYKKNLGNRHTYSCSIVESANLWIEFYSLMEKYKRRYDSQIYFLNYDKLVTNTEEETKYLLGWLGWSYSNKYLKPHLDLTTSKLNSKIINKHELSNWKNYKDILNPAIHIFNNSKKFKSLLKQYEKVFNQ